MDIFLFILGIYFLLKSRYAYVLSIIVVLTTAYLQLPVDSKYLNVLFEHNVSDLGLLLYLCFFVKIVGKYGISTQFILVKYVNIFFLFILLNGFYDYINGVSISDILRYERKWILLSIVYIAPFIEEKDIIKSLKVVYNITLLCCLLLIFQRLTGLVLIEMRFDIGRGTKPPSYSIYCAVIALINMWNFKFGKRLLHSFIFILPIILNLKMTYSFSVFGIYMLYVMLASKWSLQRKIAISICFVSISLLFLLSSSSFNERFFRMTQEVNTIRNYEASGNFSYRILHAKERLEYISSDPIMLLRGIGYVSESNFSHNTFALGTYNSESNTYAQLDTGDIVWSLLFVRLGLLGTLFYLLIYFSLIRIFYKYRDRNIFNAYWFSLLVVFLVFTSLGNALIGHDDFFIYPILFAKLNFCLR